MNHLPVLEVYPCGWSRDKAKPSMGDLVDKGIMTKLYEYGREPEARTIIWHLKKDAGVIVDNGHEKIYPGDTIRWEK